MFASVPLTNSEGVNSNEAPPQTDEMYVRRTREKADNLGVGPGRARNRKPVPSLERRAVVGPEGPVSTGAGNERSTQCCRSAGRTRHPGSGRDRQDVPERVCAAVAAGTGSGEF